MQMKKQKRESQNFSNYIEDEGGNYIQESMRQSELGGSKYRATDSVHQGSQMS